MSIVRTWYESLESHVVELVDKLVFRPDASDEQLAECIDMLDNYSIDALQLSPGERDRLEAAIHELAAALEEEKRACGS